MKPVNPYPQYYNDPEAPDGKSEASAYKLYQEGFDASTKYWNEKCTEHLELRYPDWNTPTHYPEHRFDCYRCRKEYRL